MALEVPPRERIFPFTFAIVCQKCGQLSQWKAETKDDITELRCQHCDAEIEYDKKILTCQ